MIEQVVEDKYIPDHYQDVDHEANEVGGSAEAVHGALLHCLPHHLPDVRPHAAARGAHVRVPPVR